MEYIYYIIGLVVALIGTIVWILLVKKDKEVFVKKTNKYLLFNFLIFSLLGASGLLIEGPVYGGVLPLLILLFIAILGLGIWHARLIYSYHAWSEVRSFKLVFPFTILTTLISALAFFIFFWMTENPLFGTREGLAENFSMTIPLLGMLPFFVVIAHQFWNKIPVVSQELVPFVFSVDESSKVITPSSRALRLFFEVPLRYRAKETITFEARAPLEEGLGEVFHHLLYIHNVEKRAAKTIEIAEENKRSKVYGWLFYRKTKKWWWDKKEYLNYDSKIKLLAMEGRGKIYVERVKYWEQDI